MMQSMLLGLLVLLLTSSELISAKSSSPSITPSKRKRAPTTSLVTGKSTPASSDFAKETMSMHGNEDYLSDKEAEALFQANIKQVLMGKDGKVQLAAGSPTPAPTLPPSAKLTPPDCLSEDDELESVNGIFSATNTFLKCYGNIADPLTIPTFYNGTFNGVMMVSTNIQLNNLHEVSALLTYYNFPTNVDCVISSIGGCSWQQNNDGLLFAPLLARQSLQHAFILETNESKST